jgi:hypothetical protein
VCGGGDVDAIDDGMESLGSDGAGRGSVRSCGFGVTGSRVVGLGVPLEPVVVPPYAPGGVLPGICPRIRPTRAAMTRDSSGASGASAAASSATFCQRAAGSFSRHLRMIEDAGPDDAPADDGSTKFTCGLPPSPNGACNDCIKTNCCEVSTKCADDPDCVARLECIKDCMAQYLCILSCQEGDASNIEALTTCSASNCGVCSPGPECTQLGKCALTFDADGGERILREVARGVVLEVNEEKCKAHRANLAKHKAAEPACTQPLE